MSSTPSLTTEEENEEIEFFETSAGGHGVNDDTEVWSARDAKSADSIIGGQPVEGGDAQQRVFNFSLPLSGPFGFVGVRTRQVRKLGASLVSQITSHRKQITIEPPEAHDLDLSSDEEHEAYAIGKLNPRSHALKASLIPTLASPKLPNVKGNVVVLGGYRGSILRDAQTKRAVWIPLKVGLKFRKINLEIGPSDDDELNATDSIVPGGVLSHIGPVDICRRMINQLNDQPDCNVIEFGYDWRQSLDITSSKLYKLLEDLQNASPTGEGAIVIAHSMGGLVAHHAVQKCVKEGKSFIKGIIYAGSPSECQPILGPLKFGEPVMFAKDILTPKANFLMRSSFVFLPRSGRCFIDKADKSKEYKLDFFDVNTWIEHGLSPCVSRDPQIRMRQNGLEADEDSPLLDFDVAVDYLDRTLKRARTFHEELERIPGKHYPRMAVIYGNTLPACRGSLVTSESEIKDSLLDDLWYSAGDGVVSRKTLVPLQCGFPEVPTFVTKNGHMGLLSDLDVVSQALSCVLGEDSSSENSTKSGIGSRIARKTMRMSTKTFNRARSVSFHRSGTPMKIKEPLEDESPESAVKG